MSQSEDFDALRFEAEEGTEVEVQSNQFPERFYDGWVDEQERVRADNGAVFNRLNYSVVGER